MSRPQSLVVVSPQAWRVLMSPVRTEIAEALRCGGAMSMSELASATGRPADSLYRHVELLREAGFVVPAGFRKNGRHIEQLVDVAADDFLLELNDAQGEQENLAVVDTVRSFARATERAVRDASRARELRFEQGSRNISINYEIGWLTPEAFQEVRALVRRLKSIMDEGKRKREGRMYMSFVVATPVVRKSRRRSGPRKGATRGKPHAKAATAG
ncbi:MAG: helix-turn-helix domain-containing protein [Planctomycetota bacterium]|nr:helix-turn-helix domain-containing protein [Planctomycetota bacterium]